MRVYVKTLANFHVRDVLPFVHGHEPLGAPTAAASNMLVGNGGQAIKAGPTSHQRLTYPFRPLQTAPLIVPERILLRGKDMM